MTAGGFHPQSQRLELESGSLESAKSGILLDDLIITYKQCNGNRSSSYKRSVAD